MSEIRQLFKSLLKHKFYQEIQSTIPVLSFDEIAQSLMPTIKGAQERFKKDITEDELKLLYFSEHPTLTTANKNTIEVYLENVKEEPAISDDIAHASYKTMWRNEVGRKIADFGIKLESGDFDSLEPILDFLGNVGSDFTPKDNLSEPVNLDPIDLMQKLDQKGKWTFNIPLLNQKIRRISGGQFIILLARPESGKTATIVNLIAGKDGFAAQGAKTHLMCNEEGAEVTAGRAMCCFNEIAFDALRANPKLADNDAWRQVRQNLTFVHRPEITIGQLEAYCKKFSPDVLIIDQLDHITVKGDFARSDERLGAIYRRTREIASKYNTVIIGVCQASAEAEGRSKINFSMAEGSKTSKAAAADLIVGIGRADEGAENEGNIVQRYFTVSKNKISGWKGTVIAKLIQNESRIIP